VEGNPDFGSVCHPATPRDRARFHGQVLGLLRRRRVSLPPVRRTVVPVGQQVPKPSEDEHGSPTPQAKTPPTQESQEQIGDPRTQTRLDEAPGNEEGQDNEPDGAVAEPGESPRRESVG